MSEEKFCIGCPCLHEHDPGYFFCTQLPEWKLINGPDFHYCYSGRQIMEKEAAWQRAKDSLAGKKE